MGTANFELTNPPADSRRRELWLQHAAGFILFENVRKQALDEIGEGVSAEARAVAEKAVDECMYRLMMLIEGVSGGLRNSRYEVDLRMVAQLVRTESDAVEEALDLREGDGVCMGFHGWKQGDFGDDPVAIPAPRAG